MTSVLPQSDQPLVDRPVDPPLVDPQGRTIRYLRISVTDRCDLRCRYCMAEQMTFLPRAKLLSLDEIAIIAERFIARGVTKIRLSGGEPLVRRDVGDLMRRLGRHVGAGLDELTMTTNATRLDVHAQAMADAGIRRINVSLDSLDADRFRYITRHGDVAQVLGGIAAAKAAGLAVKINMVALAGLNEDEIPAMLQWCIDEGHDLSLIETMPLGAIDEDRTDRFLPLTGVFRDLETRFRLERDSYKTGGPARYWNVDGTGTRVGLISPLTANFCEGCNRVRLTCTGTLYMCLGQNDAADLREVLRESDDPTHLAAAIDEAIARKPKGHDFIIDRNNRPAVSRHMSVTGG